MTAQTTSTTTTPPTLTATQSRALLHALLSSTPTSSPTSSSAAPKPASARASRQARPQPQLMQTHNITIDASTRIMGHCNNIHVSSPSPTEQAARINELVRGTIASVSKGNGAVNVAVNAGVSVMGSKNVIVLGSSVNRAEPLVRNDADSGMTSPTREEGSGLGRKRRAEDSAECNEAGGKKVKLEEGSEASMDA